MVIVGGGIIGVTTAIFLAANNIRVVLLEKGRIAAEQSSRNWGWIRKQGRDADELPIMIEASRLWQQLDEECGEDIGLKRSGVTYLARTQKDMAAFADFMKIAVAHEMDTHLVDQKQVSSMIRGMARTFVGAMTTPSDMRAEPWLAVPALARLAARKGVTIIENCAVRALDILAGEVAGVWTECGKIEASSVMIAGGAWSSLLLRKHGVSIPQLSVRSTVAATGPLPEFHSGAAIDHDIAFRRRRDGGYTLAPGGSNLLYIGPDAFRSMTKYIPALIANPFATSYRPMAPVGFPDSWTTSREWTPDCKSPFERMRVLNPAPGQSDLASIVRGFKKLFPQLENVCLETTWAGMIDAMPDAVPVVDRISAIRGLFVATGMSGHGFGIGPGIGRVMCAMIQGDNVGHKLDRFRLSRFTDGSPIRMGPSV